MNRKQKKALYRILIAAALLALLHSGCLTPEKAEREADETAIALATACWRASP